MILLYHKIHPDSPTSWWVSVDEFWRQMDELRRFEVVPLDAYDPLNARHVAITFDGVYDCVFRFALPILERFGYPFELFVVGESIGKTNEFDQAVEPPASFATESMLKSLVQRGGRLQWHSRTHPRLDLVDIAEVDLELIVPAALRSLDPCGFRWFAYPHGCHSVQVVEQVRTRFDGAVSCEETGPVDRFFMPRTIITNDISFSSSSVSLIIACHNYGRFAAEAIESALRQTVAPNEVLFIDDASEDGSIDVAQRYLPRIKLVKNEKNLGIVANFNKAVSLTHSDYVCILGADNRLRADFVERCKLALDNSPRAAIAYTDVLLFGPRAELAATTSASPENFHALDGVQGMFIEEFPSFDETTRNLIRTRNFIHGSSMFRRAAFDQVGGYRNAAHPEDHDLFLRIIETGWKAIRVPHPVLEYRQHSSQQANAQVGLGMELAYAHRLLREREATIARLEGQLAKRDHVLGGRSFVPRPLAALAYGFRRTILGDVGIGWQDLPLTVLRTLQWLATGPTRIKLRWLVSRYRQSGVRGSLKRAVEKFHFSSKAGPRGD